MLVRALIALNLHTLAVHSWPHTIVSRYLYYSTILFVDHRYRVTRLMDGAMTIACLSVRARVKITDYIYLPNHKHLTLEVGTKWVSAQSWDFLPCNRIEQIVMNVPTSEYLKNHLQYSIPSNNFSFIQHCQKKVLRS